MTTQQSDRTYRSSAGIIGGAVLLAIAAWLGIDALVTGHGRTPWFALAGLILAVPLIVAFTLRPAVHANDERLRIRNPFRVIVLPWAEIATLRSAYSNEVVAKSGTKYQLWALPVSLRARKKAARRATRRAAQASGQVRPGIGGIGGFTATRQFPEGADRAESDRAMDDLRELLEARGEKESAQGEITVRWAYEVVGPALAGAVVLAILFAVG
ncbi:PH domain-containing protein [Streptomyces sp. NPDC057257]|uniref:PH domain-containing protein n=1 Tax=Streptomyces sp. NPDC057257 TaxID=3346071 RepID=UPI00362CC7DE